MRKSIVILMFLSGLVLPHLTVSAQKAALSVNAGDVLCLGTIGVEFNYGVAQHWSLDASARFNPWTYYKDDVERQTQWRHQTYAVGVRYWPWYVYSGFWFGAKAQYQEYNRGGFNGRLKTEEGNAVGLGLEFGYAWMLSDSFNLNFGLGGWSGYTDYVQYECPRCGRITDKGGKWFVWPNELVIGCVFIF